MSDSKHRSDHQTAPADREVSLADAAVLLKSLMGADAPAYITLRRHASEGHLRQCEMPKQGRRRQLYSLNRLHAHYSYYGPEAGPRASERPPASSDHAPVPAAGIEEEALTRALAPLNARLDRLTSQVADLVGVRQSLQLKYDATTQMAIARAERLATEVVELQRGLRVDSQVSRMRSELEKLTTLVTHIAEQLDARPPQSS